MPTFAPSTVLRFVEGVQPSFIRVLFDAGTSANTSSSADFTPSRGYFKPGVLIAYADVEVEGSVYAFVKGVQVKLFDVPEGVRREIDVGAVFGDVLAEKIVLVGTTKVVTSDVRRVVLFYCGGLYG